MTADDNWWEFFFLEFLCSHWNWYPYQIQLSSLIFFSSTVIRCYQLSTAVKDDDSWYERKSNGIFMYRLKFIIVPNISSLCWFWFSSTVISCHQLLSAVDSYDSWYDKKLTGLFIYTLKFILLPNFSSLGWFSISSAVNSCYQLLTADDSCYKKTNWIFIYSLNVMCVTNLSSAGCLGAWLESVKPNRQTPGEYDANSSPARLVPGS